MSSLVCELSHGWGAQLVATFRHTFGDLRDPNYLKNKLNGRSFYMPIIPPSRIKRCFCRSQNAGICVALSLRPVLAMWIRHSDVFTQFSLDKQHVSVVDNVYFEELSCIYQCRLSPTPTIDLEAIAHVQVMDPDIDQILQDGSLNLAVLPISTSQNTILRDVSQGRSRSVVPAADEYTKFLALPNVAYPG